MTFGSGEKKFNNLSSWESEPFAKNIRHQGETIVLEAEKVHDGTTRNFVINQANKVSNVVHMAAASSCSCQGFFQQANYPIGERLDQWKQNSETAWHFMVFYCSGKKMEMGQRMAGIEKSCRQHREFRW